MSVVEVTATVDSWADQTAQAKNYGDKVKLWVKGGGSNEKRAYVFFAPPFPLGATILAATLRLHLAEAWGGSQTLSATRIVDSWKESKLNWNNKPAVDAAEQADVSVASLSAGDEVELDVTDLMAAVSAGATFYGMRLEIDASVSRALVSSDDPDVSLRPELEVEWSEAPQAPTSLAPAGGRVVSVTRPRLTWQFVDNAGSVVQAESQVQVSTSTDFSSPSYDSGWVANTISAWDLAATAFSALSDGNIRYWRVRVRDGAGLTSEWSDPVSWERESDGALTITNPAAPASNFVEETTPPITWTFTGRTQEAYQVRIYRVNADSSLTQLADSGRTASTDTSWTVPSGILRTGDDYRVEVTVWDDLDRQAIAGDPDYVRATRDFTYERSGSPAAVTALTATPDGAKVVLEWTRATAPDYFAVVVDGVEVEDRIDPTDVLVSGTDYALDWWRATPRVESTYEIEAVVLDSGVLKHSDGNATDTATTDPIGIWLADPTDSTGVFIAGKEKAEMGIGETAETLARSGNRTPVRITESVEGYAGSFAGILVDTDDQDAAEARDTFLMLKGRLTELRLIIGDLNIPVRLEEVSAIPEPDASAGYRISFAFFQTDEFTFDVTGD